MIKRCVICGREFRAQRSTAKYCSNRCRHMAQRGITLAVQGGAPKPGESMSQEDVEDVVQRAHTLASDLSRASMLTTAPLCRSLMEVSHKLEDALRGEGL